MHLILLTRVDLPLPLARWRGRGRMTEIRDHHLCFPVEEADEFLNTLLALNLPGEAVAILEGRTEGWIAGLQMVALSLQSRRQEGNLAAQDPRFHQMPNLAVFLDLLAHPHARPVVTTPLSPALNEALGKTEEALLHHGSDPASLLDRVQQRVCAPAGAGVGGHDRLCVDLAAKT
jgi:hypothetical protein